MTKSQQSIADLLEQFRKETCIHSSMVDILHKPSSVALIAIGEPVVTHIFRHEITLSLHHMTLLHKITGQNPLPKDDAGIVREMREHWLNWATENDYR